jgi:proteasome lid subunit RPN8/RPN11
MNEAIDSQSANESTQLPNNVILLGEVEVDDVKLYIQQDVYKKILKLSSSNVDKEIGSILLGKDVNFLGKMHIIIEDFIEAKYTDSTNFSLTFTHETWNYIHKEMDKKNKNLKIIGWHHTHPNYGIFLSDYDLFIQENFFNLPFQIAMVVDPIKNLTGFFQWKNEKIVKVNGFYLFDDVGKKVINPVKIPKSGSLLEKPKLSLSMIIGILNICFIVLLIFFYKGQIDDINNSMQNEKLAQSRKIEDLGISIQEMSNRIKEKDLEVSHLILKLDTKFGDYLSNSKGMYYLKEYQVQKGDTVSSICNSPKLNRLLCMRIVESINKLKSPDIIILGEYIWIPVSFSEEREE